MMEYQNTITVLIRDDAPLLYAGDSPAYRTVQIALPESQMKLLRLREHEEISKCFIEPVVTFASEDKPPATPKPSSGISRS